jgi:hypothetical protein
MIGTARADTPDIYLAAIQPVRQAYDCRNALVSRKGKIPERWSRFLAQLGHPAVLDSLFPVTILLLFVTASLLSCRFLSAQPHLRPMTVIPGLPNRPAPGYQASGEPVESKWRVRARYSLSAHS